jgi:CubicO group peptidase (beta-lactamase class C family)
MAARLFLLLLSLAWSLCAKTDAASLSRIIEETRKAFHVPGIAVAVVHDDSVVFAKGFGVRKLEAPEVVTPDTRFAIGSTTKAFTTAAMGILVDEGKMAWDDPVRKHIPFFHLSDPLADSNVTMRDIVSHRTGLSRNDLLWYGSPWGSEEIIRRIGVVPLSKSFRSAYQYQNIMFLTAGYAVGRIAGSSWEDFVCGRIWEPLGMRNSDFSVREVVHAADYATPHEEREGKVVSIPWRNIDNIAPAGAINSSANDLSKWVRMQLNGGAFGGRRILKEKTLLETHTPQTVMRLDDPNSRTVNIGTHVMSYGLGWVIQDYRGHSMVSHGGAIDGFRSQVTLLPEEHYGIIILANLGGNNMPECLRSALADELLDLAPMGWNEKYLEVQKKREEEQEKKGLERDAKRRKDTKPSRELEAYAGEFENPAYGKAVITAADGGLELRWSNWNARLAHFQFDTFLSAPDRTPLGDSLVQFQLDEEGNVSTVQFIDQQFRRKKT